MAKSISDCGGIRPPKVLTQKELEKIAGKKNKDRTTKKPANTDKKQ